MQLPVEEDPFAGVRKLRKSRIWRVVATLVTASALLVVLAMLANVWPSLLVQSSSIKPEWLALGFILCSIAAYITFLPFASIVKAETLRDIQLREIAHLYFTSQLLKHLPGRIWGIGYQWAAAGRVDSVGSWLSANFLHMLLATFFALASSTIVLSSGAGWQAMVLAVLVAAASYAAIWPGISILRSVAGRLKKMQRLEALLASYARFSENNRVRVFLLFSLSWIIYYAGWYSFGVAYPSVGGSGGLRICAYYLLAWFVGYISLLTPSGIGVRELAFAWFAKDFPPDAIALMAAIGRVSLLGVDMVWGLIFAPFSPAKN